MLSVAEALSAVVREIEPFSPATIPLSDALGLLLAEEVVSDVDSPPFDKSLMDGYAVRADDIADGRALLKVIEEVTAGRVPTKSIGRGETTRVMTGAPLPQGSDAVVRLEDTQLDTLSDTVRIDTDPASSARNVMRRGASLKRGDHVFAPGRLLRPQELGALAERGRNAVGVRVRPRVAVLATGDELVPIDETPKPGQIRNSNETMLVAQLRVAGAEPVPLGIARDERTHLSERIRAGLECDMLLLSGGVSAGKLDLVPSELEAAGVRQVFHMVNLKPGKPVWFGVWDAAPDNPAGRQDRRCYVFGLPGNPVSSMVCCELFARTAIRRLIGYQNPEPQQVRAKLSVAHTTRGNRPTYHPARLTWEESEAIVTPVNWQGSADLRATVDANSMIVFRGVDRSYAAGDVVDTVLWDR
ncbi:MAG: gephyrin-like molybdotransferase Glp [Planctomycetaceae bacterium]